MPKELAKHRPLAESTRLSDSGSLQSFGRFVVLFFLVLSVVRVLRPALLYEDHLLYVGDEGTIRIQDFASHLTFAKTYWHGRGDYSVAGHLRMTSDWAEQPMSYALPFGYSPTMLAVLAPICPLPHVWAYVAWTLLAAVLVGWMLTHSSPLGESPPVKSIWVFAAGLVLLGPIGAGCLANGQTAIFTTAVLLCMALRNVGRSGATPHGDRSFRDDVLLAVLLWLLTAKPPLAITGGMALLACRRFRAIGMAVALTLASTWLLGLGFVNAVNPNGWIKDYLHLFGSYNLDAIDVAYAWSIHPEAMGNLRGLLHRWCGVGDALANQISSGAWLLVLAAIVVARWMGRIRLSHVWSLAVMAYLLFCPHVSFTELTHLVIPLILISRHAVGGFSKALQWSGAALIVLMVMMQLTWAVRQPVLIGLEVGLVVVLLAYRFGAEKPVSFQTAP